MKNSVLDSKVCSWDSLILETASPRTHKPKIVNESLKEDIQIFRMNMPFISSSEVKNVHFTSGEATNEIFIFSLHEMK